MEKLLEKISKYNLFNNLIPGIIFLYLIKITKDIDIVSNITHNTVNYFVIAYFFGIIISRFGSLIIEPFLRKIKFLDFASYSDYISASKNDEIIKILSEENNAYRSYISLLVLFFIVHFVICIVEFYHFNRDKVIFYILILLLIMFLWAYKKQTKYIKSRIINNLKKE